MKKKYLYTVNNFQLGSLVPSTQTDLIISQNRTDKSHTEIIYLFETDRQRELTEEILNKKGTFLGFVRQKEMSKYEVVQCIMDHPDWDEDCKLFKIESFLKGWLTAEQATGTAF